MSQVASQATQLTPGQIARIRQRTYLVEEIVKPKRAADSTLVRLSCVGAWHADRLNHSIELLNSAVRVAAETACRKHSEHRNWKLWAVNARTTHVHAVVSAHEHKGTVVRDQLKANCTGQIRKVNKLFIDRPVWAVGGDVEFVWTEDELSNVIDYTLIAQDRKGLELDSKPVGVSPGFRAIKPQDASPSSLSSRVSKGARQPGLAPNGLLGRDHV